MNNYKNKTLLASKGITLLVDPYLVARIFNSKLRSIIGIKFIDNNTVVHIISSKINNKSVTLYGNHRKGITSLLSSQRGLLDFILATVFLATVLIIYNYLPIILVIVEA